MSDKKTTFLNEYSFISTNKMKKLKKAFSKAKPKPSDQ